MKTSTKSPSQKQRPLIKKKGLTKQVKRKGRTKQGFTLNKDGTFDSKTVSQLQTIEEIRILTSTPDGKKHRATIWVVVLDGAVFVRSFTGPKGQWYQNILANGEADLEVARKTIHVKAVSVRDAAINEQVSKAYLDKYRGSPYAHGAARGTSDHTSARTSVTAAAPRRHEDRRPWHWSRLSRYLRLRIQG